MTTPTKTRVHHLLALATDPNTTEEEARSAAFKAAQLIKQQGLYVGPQRKQDLFTTTKPTDFYSNLMRALEHAEMEMSNSTRLQLQLNAANKTIETLRKRRRSEAIVSLIVTISLAAHVTLQYFYK